MIMYQWLFLCALVSIVSSDDVLHRQKRQGFNPFGQQPPQNRPQNPFQSFGHLIGQFASQVIQPQGQQQGQQQGQPQGQQPGQPQIQVVNPFGQPGDPSVSIGFGPFTIGFGPPPTSPTTTTTTTTTTPVVNPFVTSRPTVAPVTVLSATVGPVTNSSDYDDYYEIDYGGGDYNVTDYADYDVESTTQPGTTATTTRPGRRPNRKKRPNRNNGNGRRPNRKKNKNKNGNNNNNRPNRRPNNRPNRRPNNRPNRRPNRRPGRRPNKKPNRRPNRRPNKKPNNRPGNNNNNNNNQQTTPTSAPLQNIPEELKVLGWINRIENKGIQVPQNNFESRFFLLGFDQPYQEFHRCSSNAGGNGVCTYLQYCILPSFINNFNNFLQHLCFIDGFHVGVCCPDQTTTTTRRPTTTRPTPPPTPRPTTANPQSRGCGRNNKFITRIVGGKPADPKEWPWMAALLRPNNENFCGGTLITNRHILTAAHCVDRLQPRDVIVRLGEYDFSNSVSSAAKNYQTQSITQHERFDRQTLENDIAMLALTTEHVGFNDEIWPVCLPPPNRLFTNENAIVTGWGTVYFGGPVSNVLLEVLLPVWTNEECDRVFTQPIRSTNLCAGIRQGGKDACQGDSGGPLLYFDRESSRWSVIGVVSWGIRCAEVNYPGVYTRVNMYLEWIQNTAFAT